MKTVTVRRSTWVRGSIGGQSLLLNHDGNMCCLGFAICQVSRHIRLCGLKGVGDPQKVFARASFLTQRNEYGEVLNNKFSNKAIEINDSNEISEKQREARLKRLFRANGIKLTFVD